MKKLIATLLVIALAAPAFAASVDLADNGDGTGTITLTVGEGEVVRGVAVEVSADTDIIAVTGTDPIFNVFMDAAYDAETAEGADPENPDYVLGTGSPVAVLGTAGVQELPATGISLSMGVLDEDGDETLGEGAGEGTYTLGIIDLGGAGCVTLAADTTRGGVVGDNIADVTYPTGQVCVTDDGGTTCIGNVTSPGIDGYGMDPVTFMPIWEGNFTPDNQVDTSDLQAMVNVLVEEGTGYVVTSYDSKYEPFNIASPGSDGYGMDPVTFMPIWEGTFIKDSQIDTADLQALVNILVEEGGSEYLAPCPW